VQLKMETELEKSKKSKDDQKKTKKRTAKSGFA
jgi:hypothetical protein